MSSVVPNLSFRAMYSCLVKRRTNEYRKTEISTAIRSGLHYYSFKPLLPIRRKVFVRLVNR
jgi:hypothetical protein